MLKYRCLLSQPFLFFLPGWKLLFLGMGTGIGLTQDLDRVDNLVRRKLGKLQAAAQAIGHNIFRFECFYFVHQSAPQVNGCVVKLFFKSHNSGHTTAKKVSFDMLQGDIRDYFQQVQVRLPNILLS
jgi:hypothetical protein